MHMAMSRATGAGHAVTVGHRDLHVAIPYEQPNAVHDPCVNEVVGRPTVVEGKELMTMDVDMEVRSLLIVDADEGVEGDNWGNRRLLL